MFFRVLKESLVRAKGRQLLAMIAIALGAAVATATLALFLTAGDRVSHELRSFGANIAVTPASDTLPVEIGGVDYRPVAEGSYLPEDALPKLKTIFWRNNIVGFAPFLDVPVQLKDGQRVVLTGTWFDRGFKIANGETYHTGVRATNPTWKVEGAWPVDGFGPGDAVYYQNWPTDGSGTPRALVGRSIATRLGLRAGSSLVVLNESSEALAIAMWPNAPAPGTTPSSIGVTNLESFKVVGILSTGGVEEEQIFVPLPLAQLLAWKPGKFRRLQVSAITQPEDAFGRRDPDTMSAVDREKWSCTPYVSSIIDQIQTALPGSVGRQVRQVEQSEEQIMTRIRLLLALIAAGALAASALAVSSATAAVVLERRTEIALMKALGSPEWLVASFFLAEASLQGLVGGGAGYVAGLFLARLAGQQVFGAPAEPPGIVLPAVLLLALLISWIGAMAPLRSVIKVRPAVVLKEAA